MPNTAPPPPPSSIPPLGGRASRRLNLLGAILIVGCFAMGVFPFVIMGLSLGIRWGVSWAQQVPIPPTGPGIGLAPDLSDLGALAEQGAKVVAATLFGTAVVMGVGSFLMLKVCRLLIAPRLREIPAFSRPVPPPRPVRQPPR